MKLLTLSCIALLTSTAMADVEWSWNDGSRRPGSPIVGTCTAERDAWSINGISIKTPLNYCILYTGPNCDGASVQLNAGNWKLSNGQSNSYKCY